MRCPVCKSFQNKEIDLHVDQFYEDLYECTTCGSSWSVAHGLTEVVKDSQLASFLEGTTETVECDDYCLVG